MLFLVFLILLLAHASLVFPHLITNNECYNYNKVYDVGIIGIDSDYKKNIFNELKNKNINVHEIVDINDYFIFYRHKIIINLYNNKNYSILDETIFKKSLINKIILISEKTYFNYFDFLFHKLDKNYSKNIDNILFIRTLTFELFQKEYRKLSAIFKSKLFYCIAPFYDQQKLLCDQHFSKYNVSSSSFKNMNIFLNNSTFKHNLFFIILDHQDLFVEFFLKLNNFYIFKNIFKIRSIYIGRGNNYFNITKTTYIFVSILIFLISIPLFLLSIILFVILINPLKFYSKSI